MQRFSTNPDAPIGIFDSGVGGLTVMKQLIRAMPDEDMVYFGDTARVPYGSKSKDTILAYTRQIIAFLQTKAVKAIVIACNTASAYALSSVENELPIPIIGVIEPGARAAMAETKNGKVGIIGTYATISSGAYETFIRKNQPQTEIFARPCPLFVPFVEEGMTDDPITDEIIARYLSELKAANIDTLLLGCTHYPLIKPAIKRFMGESVNCVDPAQNAAEQMRDELIKRNLRRESSNEMPHYHFYVSDAAQRMTDFANRIMPFAIEKTQKVKIEEYGL